MNIRPWLVVGVFLALPAWSQEPAAASPDVTRAAFDLYGDPVKKILRDTAASQFAAPRLTEPRPAKEPSIEQAVLFVPPEVKPARKTAKLNLPPMPRAEESTFLSALVETLIEEAFDLPRDDAVEMNEIGWLACQSTIDLKRETLGNGSCNR